MRPFSGNDKDDDPEDFILKMELQIELRFIPEEVKVTFIATHFEGKALKWYTRLDNYTKKDIKLFEKAFLERFPPRVQKESVMDHVQKYLNLHQTTSVQSYNQRFRDLVSLLPDNLFSPQAHLIIYTLGLKKIIGYEVSQRNISNLDEAMETASRYEAATNVQERVFRRPRKFGYPEVKEFDRAPDNSDKMEVDSVLTRRDNTRRKCYNCLQEGHVVAKCPQKSNDRSKN